MKIAVHCKTEDEWYKVRAKVGISDGYTYRKPTIREDDYIVKPGESDWVRRSALGEGYTIISAQEYLGGEEMTETERKFGEETPRLVAICKECGQRYNEHIGSECRQETTNNIKKEEEALEKD